MPVAEFEEKSFEGPLNAQLLAGSTLLYTPGQVVESVLGFDAAMLTHHVGFWRLWNFHHPPTGLVANPSWWGASARRVPPLPAFNMNLFLQYKRPALLERSNATEWNQWSAPYYRYPITAHQQAALETCAKTLGGNGLVVYASPAFWRVNDLFSFTSARTLVDNTNFVEAAKLSGHGVYTYVAAGRNGFAFSDPEEVPSIPGSGGIGERVRSAPEMSDGENAFKLAHRALKAAAEGSGLLDVGEVAAAADAAFDAIRSPLLQLVREEDVDEVAHPYVRAILFSWLLGVGWVMAAPGRGGRGPAR